MRPDFFKFLTLTLRVAETYQVQIQRLNDSECSRQRSHLKIHGDFIKSHLLSLRYATPKLEKIKLLSRFRLTNPKVQPIFSL
jgi:hypothetical protein